MITVIFTVLVIIAILVLMKVWPPVHDFVMHWWTLVVGFFAAVAAAIVKWFDLVPPA